MSKTVQCQLCPKKCILRPGERGNCRVRANINGKLVTLVYGKAATYHVDPIEKKPLFHFYPATRIFSIATAGCNMHCLNCQNWELSQSNPEDINSIDLSPEMIVDAVTRYRIPSIAYTYNEPVIFYEYVYDTSKLSREKGIKNVLVTAALINQEPLKELLKYIDAATVDIKAMSESFYRKICDGYLEPVLEAVKTMWQTGIHLELSNLVIPTLNDDDASIKRLTDWIATNISTDVPLHFLRFFPQYKMKHIYPTPVKTLEKVREIAKNSGMKYVYIGNVPGHPAESTYCPRCGRLLIKRIGYFVVENHIKNGKCPYCGYPIYGRWNQ